MSSGQGSPKKCRAYLGLHWDNLFVTCFIVFVVLWLFLAVYGCFVAVYGFVLHFLAAKQKHNVVEARIIRVWGR